MFCGPKPPDLFLKGDGRSFLFRAGVSVKPLAVPSVLNRFFGTAADNCVLDHVYLAVINMAKQKPILRRSTGL